MAFLKQIINGVFYGKNRIRIAMLILFGILFLAVVVRPGIIGYATYQKVKDLNYTIEEYGEDINKLKSELLISNTNLSSCMEFSEKIFVEIEKQLDKFSECRSELSAISISLNFSKERYEEIIKNLQEDLDRKASEIDELGEQKDKEISDLRLQYDLIVQNAANNICCKAKVDNPDIKYYKVEDNRIICLEEGVLNITC